MTTKYTNRPPLSPPDLQWENNAPISKTFQDVYFSSEDGLEESDYVFLQGNRLENRWKNWAPRSLDYFTIIETGFGTGLNFLSSWCLWEKAAPINYRLHYVSVEKHPLNKADIHLALKQWPSLSIKMAELLQQYPQSLPGIHRLTLAEEKIHLTLIWGDALHSLSTFNGTADAWFLDGFTPSRNPDMWTPALYEQIARLSNDNTTISTFTAASAVRKGLIKAGFNIEKEKATRSSERC